jgi:hypothetical protein
VDVAQLKRLAIVALLATPLALGMVVDLPLCPSAALLGLPCPGCGLTRATLALLHGDVVAAFRFHPLVFVLTPAYVGLLGAIAFGYVRGAPALAPAGPGAVRPRGILLSRVVTRLVWVLVILVFAVWVLRFFGWFGGPVPVERLGAHSRHSHLRQGLPPQSASSTHWTQKLSAG